ncbi:MAG: alpha-glucosidase [Treponema sp.]|nr:alpha-glucosidase [Treponema sp.]
MPNTPWWKERVAYQIYPRSFQDSSATGTPDDGIGDIPGIISRLDEIQDLGAGIIWLSPVYRSPDADNGYDISDYYAIDPRYGTMEDMERLFAEAAKRDIKIIMDLVINHTSDEHHWFQESRDPLSPYRDYYIWRKPRIDRRGRKAPPNNWTGFFMGDVWEYDEQSDEYYLHLFDKKQPDLNYQNPRVIEEVKKILQFWLDKGAGGFRCDVINIIYKESLEDGKQDLLSRLVPVVRGLEHYKGREGNHAILRELRAEVLDRYDCFTVGETVMVDLEDAKLLCDQKRRELNMLFYFEHLEVDRRIARFIPKRFRAAKLLSVLSKWQRGLEWNAVYLENHDQSRIVSHFGAARGKLLKRAYPWTAEDTLAWERSAKMLALLQMTLKGTPFVYQGQEIGMTNFDYEGLDEVKDVESQGLNKLMKSMGVPRFLRWKWIRASSRDNGRTPMQWDGTENAGFSKGRPWLGLNSNFKHINYEAQRDDPRSVLSFYKALITLRKNNPCLREGDFIPLYGDRRLMVYRRRNAKGESYTLGLNFSGKETKIPRKVRAHLQGKVLVSNTDRKEAPRGSLLPWEGILIRMEDGE